MEELVGEWVILENDKIIEHNKDIKVILELAEKYDDEKITISKIPSSNHGFY